MFKAFSYSTSLVLLSLGLLACGGGGGGRMAQAVQRWRRER